MGRACVAACAAMPAVSDMMPSAVSKLIPSVVVDSASGCTVTATDGRQYLDFASGIGTLSTGHCHPRVVSAVQEQAGKCIMAQQNVFGTHTAQVRSFLAPAVCFQVFYTDVAIPDEIVR